MRPCKGKSGGCLAMKTGSISLNYLRRVSLCFWADLSIWAGKFLVFSLVFSCVLSIPVVAQVHLRDTMSISPRHVSRVETDGEFVAPETGVIMIGPYELDEIADSPLPDSACVKISVNDTLRYRFDLIPFFGADGNAEVFSSQVPFYNQCTDQYATFIWSGYVYWWYNFDNHPDSIYSTDNGPGRDGCCGQICSIANLRNIPHNCLFGIRSFREGYGEFKRSSACTG